MGIFVLRMSSFIRLRYCPFEETLQSVIIYFTRVTELAVGNWDPESDKNNRAELMDLESKVWSEVAHYSFQKG